MKYPAGITFILSAISFALCILEGDALVGAVVFMALAGSLVLLLVSDKWKVSAVPLLIAAVTVLAGTVLLLYVLNWSEGSGMSQTLSSHIEGVVVWTMTFPVAYMILSIYVLVSDAALNRVLAGGFTAFFSIGLLTLVWVFLAIFCFGDLDTKYLFSMETAYIFVNMVLSLVAAVVVSVALKGKSWRLKRIPAEVSP